MATVEWTDERLNDAFENLRREVADMRAEMRVGFSDLRAEVKADIRMLWATMIGGFVAIVTALLGVIATQL